jgi:ribosomal protein S24E
MKYQEDFRYMSLIQPVSDVNNTFLSRREITCNFAGLAGKLKKLEAIDMITKEFDLGNKVVIPMRLKSHSGKSIVTGTFFVYDDEGLAKKHIDPTIFTRLEKSKAKKAEAEKAEAPAETESPAETETPAEGTESKADVTEPEESKEEKSE